MPPPPPPPPPPPEDDDGHDDWFAELKLHKNDIADDGAYALSQYILHHAYAAKSLEQLHLSHNQITQIGAKHIIVELFPRISAPTSDAKVRRLEFCFGAIARRGPSQGETARKCMGGRGAKWRTGAAGFNHELLQR